MLPRPQTPPHADHQLSRALLGLTIEHEAFILAHEMAHLQLGHLQRRGKRDPQLDDLHPTVAVWLKNGVSDDVLREFDADGRALQWCVKLFGGKSAYDTEGILMMIFQLSRYLMWLEMALREGSKASPDEDFLWAARHFRLRRSISAYGPPMALAAIAHSEWLEENWEPGANAGIAMYMELMDSEPR